FERSPCHSPRRVERALAGEAFYQHTVGVKDVNEAAPGAGGVILLLGVLLRVSDVQLAVDGRNAEGREARRQMLVSEHASRADRLELRVEHIHCSGVEVGGKQEGARTVETDRETFVHGPRSRIIDNDRGRSGTDGRVPTGDYAVLRREQFRGGSGR